MGFLKKSFLALAFVVTSAHGAPEKVMADGYPQDLATEILQQQRNEQAANAKSPSVAASYLINARRWGPGETVLVAFNGGSPELQGAIATAAREWMKYANLKLDFGYNPQTKLYRQWSTSDKTRAAHIRIGFAEYGYWSAIGTDSMIEIPFAANRPSMNFQGFAASWPNLMPKNWRTVVLHEFAHALGFRHEHQQKNCFSEIRWEPGPHGEPDLYQVFKNWQGWSKEIVDVNMRPIDPGDVAVAGLLDTKSVTYYASPAQIYILGEKSKCFIKEENSEISAEDARGAMLAYPKNATAAVQVASLSPAEMTKVWAAAASDLGSAEQTAVNRRIAAQSNAKRPLLYIQIHGKQGMDVAKRLQTKASDSGFFVPGIEDVEPKNLKSGPVTEIRYFRKIDEEYANQAAAVVKEVMGEQPRIIENLKFEKRVTRNMIEVWFPKL